MILTVSIVLKCVYVSTTVPLCGCIVCLASVAIAVSTGTSVH